MYCKLFFIVIICPIFNQKTCTGIHVSFLAAVEALLYMFVVVEVTFAVEDNTQTPLRRATESNFGDSFVLRCEVPLSLK